MTQIGVHVPDDLEDRSPAELLETIGRIQRARYDLSSEEHRVQKELDRREEQ